MANASSTVVDRSSRALRVLIVEDSEDDAVLLLAELRRGGYDMTWQRVETGQGLKDQLAATTWDLVISDRQPSEVQRTGGAPDRQAPGWRSPVHHRVRQHW